MAKSFSQNSFFDESHVIAAPIPGLIYIPEYISQQQENDLIRIIDAQPWITELKRRVQHYGYRYDYKARNITPESKLEPLPEWLLSYCEQLHTDNIFSYLPDQVIINEYQPGQGIAPHIDCVPCFEETIASLSLSSPCVMDFTHVDTGEKIPILLEPCSLVVLSSDARYRWQHAISQRKTDKYNGKIIPRSRRISLTFRKVILVE